MTLSPEQFKHQQDNVAEATYRAAVARVQAGPEAAAKGDALTANVPDLFARTFVSPENKKGRQHSYLATPEELHEWRTKQ